MAADTVVGSRSGTAGWVPRGEPAAAGGLCRAAALAAL